MAVDSYDEIPYDSTPIYETHPANLAVPGSLFGLRPASPQQCRYLELGCASGGNLIPLAYHLPDSEFLGIERSAAQVRAAQALIDQLGLRNIRIEQADVHAVDPRALGTFDYIVAHGFFSWVPDAVRRRLFEITAATLAPHGIAYVSYNTLPGWRWHAALRDLLRYHVRGLDTPRARLAAARDGLERFQAALAGQADVMSGTLRDEIARLRTRHPSYLYHEYLVDENTPFLFSEFMASAGRHDLQYLCEAALQTMFSDNLGDPAASWIDTFDDVIVQEQYMDFLRQRSFRQTLLCRSGMALQRELDLGQFAALAWHASLVPEGTPDLTRAGAQVFVGHEGSRCVATHPLAKAALLELSARHPDAIAFPELAERARRRVQAAGGPDGDSDALLPELVRFYLRQDIGAALLPEQLPRTRRARPRASRLAHAQVQSGLEHVATYRHKPMGVDAFVAGLIGRLDGRHEPDEIVTLLQQDIASGRIALDTQEAGSAPSRAVLAANVGRMLEMFDRHGILDPES